MSMLNADKSSSSGQNSSSVHFAIHVQEIMEVVLSNATAGYQPEADLLVKIESIGAQNEWAPFAAGSETIGNASVSTFSVHDKHHFFAKGSIALSDFSGHDVSSDYIKYDFGIRRWQYWVRHTKRMGTVVVSCSK